MFYSFYMGFDYRLPVRGGPGVITHNPEGIFFFGKIFPPENEASPPENKTGPVFGPFCFRVFIH